MDVTPSALDARMIVLRRGKAICPHDYEWTLGLLSKAPDPEGHDFVEIGGPGYARQPMRLELSSPRAPASAMLNVGRVTFPVIEQDTPVVVTHAAAFADGELLFYAPLYHHSHNLQHGPLTFPAGTVKLRQQ